MTDWWLPALLGVALLNLLGLLWLATRRVDTSATTESLRQALQTAVDAQRAQAEQAGRELRTELQDSARSGRSGVGSVVAGAGVGLSGPASVTGSTSHTRRSSS